jgi:hypothetical protein
VTTKRVIDHTVDREFGAARVTVREVIRALQVLPGSYELRLDFDADGVPGNAPVWYVDINRETQEVSFG